MSSSISQIDRQIEPFRSLPLRRLLALVTTGKCGGKGGTERFFPVEPSDLYADRRREYEEYAFWQCQGCPTRSACLLLALRAESQPRNSIPHGIFGGMAPWARESMVRRLRRRGIKLDISPATLAQEARDKAAKRRRTPRRTQEVAS